MWGGLSSTNRIPGGPGCWPFRAGAPAPERKGLRPEPRLGTTGNLGLAARPWKLPRPYVRFSPSATCRPSQPLTRTAAPSSRSHGQNLWFCRWAGLAIRRRAGQASRHACGQILPGLGSARTRHASAAVRLRDCQGLQRLPRYTGDSTVPVLQSYPPRYQADPGADVSVRRQPGGNVCARNHDWAQPGTQG